MGATTTRRNLNAERAAELILNWKSSGQSAKDYAEAHGLTELTLLRWHRRLQSTSATTAITPTFVQVQPMPCGDITVHAQGVSIQVPVVLLDSSLPTILRLLRC